MSTTNNITAPTGKIKTRAEGDRLTAVLARTVATAPETQVSNVLNWAARQLNKDGILTREYAQSLHDAALEAGLPESEAVATILAAGDRKRCPRCKTTKPVEDFHRNRTRPDGRQDYCKTCHAEVTKPKKPTAPARFKQDKTGDFWFGPVITLHGLTLRTFWEPTEGIYFDIEAPVHPVGLAQLKNLHNVIGFAIAEVEK
ncbi:hypothetical protein [Kocuria rosea]|uniref:hypothetical protein n=1 Tax=Kocuria rosea TaxID=1275 RepID=UPI00119CD3E7|nr:hypothetical protein [Kocuria rosea]